MAGRAQCHDPTADRQLTTENAMLRNHQRLRLTVRTAALVAAALVSSAGVTRASDSCGPRTTWKTVVTYQTIPQPAVHWVTRYDACGRPYRVPVTTYRTVTVPVVRQVKVYH